jgi:hypothetical protein
MITDLVLLFLNDNQSQKYQLKLLSYSIQYQNVKRQLTYEKLNDGTDRSFSDLNDKDQIALVKSRLKLYANSVYRKTKV